MTTWSAEMENALRDFATVAGLGCAPICWEDFELEYWEAPHKPPSRLPQGTMAVYGFWYAGQWLKIGLAGPNSGARYTSQHYSPNSAPSTLAASVVNDPHMVRSGGFSSNAVGDWIKSETSRVNILVDAKHGMSQLRLLEAFLHVRLKPRYER